MTTQTGVRRSRLSPLTLTVLFVSTAWLAFAGMTQGLAGILLAAGVIGLMTATYSLVTGRRSWAFIPTRTIAAIVVAVATIALVIGGAIR